MTPTTSAPSRLLVATVALLLRLSSASGSGIHTLVHPRADHAQGHRLVLEALARGAVAQLLAWFWLDVQHWHPSRPSVPTSVKTECRPRALESKYFPIPERPRGQSVACRHPTQLGDHLAVVVCASQLYWNHNSHRHPPRERTAPAAAVAWLRQGCAAGEAGGLGVGGAAPEHEVGGGAFWCLRELLPEGRQVLLDTLIEDPDQGVTSSCRCCWIRRSCSAVNRSTGQTRRRPLTTAKSRPACSRPHSTATAGLRSRFVVGGSELTECLIIRLRCMARSFM